MKNPIKLAKNVYCRIARIEDKVDILLSSEGGRGPFNKSYAQWGEDIVVYNLFKIIPSDKTYIDIGAHNPLEISNTAFMFQNGWSGINIEPNPILFKAFENVRPNDVNLCCGVAGERGNLPFYMIDDYSGRNSFDKECVERFLEKEAPGYKIEKVLNIEVLTLTDIINKYADGKCPDYMTIDTENLEYEILSAHDMKNNGPKVCTMEVSSKKDEMEKMMKEAGYFLWLKIACNWTWVKEEYKSLIMK